jgi:hypothetical protein
MRAMFANLTRADFGGRSKRERATARRKWVHALFDEIQVAIHKGDRAKVDFLMAELADATAQRRPITRSVFGSLGEPLE